MNWQPPTPDPTPAQIRRRCLAIQRAWSDEERYRRRVHLDNGTSLANCYAVEPYYTVPVIRMADVEAVAG